MIYIFVYVHRARCFWKLSKSNVVVQCSREGTVQPMCGSQKIQLQKAVLLDKLICLLRRFFYYPKNPGIS